MDIEEKPWMKMGVGGRENNGLGYFGLLTKCSLLDTLAI